MPVIGMDGMSRYRLHHTQDYFDGSVQDCSISSALVQLDARYTRLNEARCYANIYDIKIETWDNGW